MKKKGFIHIYTGNGKGKTTASIGIAVRAAGAGHKVCVIQFLKKGFFSELKSLKKILNIDVLQFGSGRFITKRIGKKERHSFARGIKHAEKVLRAGKYNVVILDEINIAPALGMIKTEELVRLIEKKSKKTELILTGRRAPKALIKIADLVTVMKECKHYYNTGVRAREGVEF